MTGTKKIAILGAGPVGLEAAHALADAGHDVCIYEQGEVGQAIRHWGHVKFFSPWSLNVSPLGLKALAEQSLDAPDGEAFPTGAQYVARYLEPLARHPRLEGRVHTGTRVVQIGRESVLKGELIASAKRREHPFRLLLEDADGRERLAHAQVIIDTTGTYTQPNALGDAGIPAPGERQATREARISHYIPDLAGADEARFANKHTVVVGAGYSAITTLKGLLGLQERTDDTRITWLTRTADVPYERLADDPLPERDELCVLGNELAAGDRGPEVTHYGGVGVEAIEQTSGGSLSLFLRPGVEGAQAPDAIVDVDHIIANTGYHPDADLYRELQVHQCYASEGPMKLAAALLSAGGGGGDCLAQASPGPETLKSPEPDFFILGAKSYGRGSSFLIKLGLEQIADVASLLA